VIVIDMLRNDPIIKVADMSKQTGIPIRTVERIMADLRKKGNALSSEEFAGFISKNEIGEFYLAGADATACVKSTCNNLIKAKHKVTVLSDCITSYDKKKIPEMLRYYESKGSEIVDLNNLCNGDAP